MNSVSGAPSGCPDGDQKKYATNGTRFTTRTSQSNGFVDPTHPEDAPWSSKTRTRGVNSPADS